MILNQHTHPFYFDYQSLKISNKFIAEGVRLQEGEKNNHFLFSFGFSFKATCFLNDYDNNTMISILGK